MGLWHVKGIFISQAVQWDWNIARFCCNYIVPQDPYMVCLPTFGWFSWVSCSENIHSHENPFPWTIWVWVCTYIWSFCFPGSCEIIEGILQPMMDWSTSESNGLPLKITFWMKVALITRGSIQDRVETQFTAIYYSLGLQDPVINYEGSLSDSVRSLPVSK